MIILDTNVLSEVTSNNPEPRVVAWLDLQFDDVFITAVTVGELSYGVSLKPAGRRRSELADRMARVLAEFEDRVLPFDDRAALEYGRLVAARQLSGRPVGRLDAQIASIAIAHEDSVVATRDVRSFEHPGLRVVDPWAA